ncbi:MAG TPA: hypothetical protein VL595_27320 [Pseudonocardia sp.]|jgi:hypothetical protein|nr:hypothetical protein [Pseudonocardia sp.]
MTTTVSSTAAAPTTRPHVDASIQRIGAWLAPISMAVFGIGFWWIAGFIPPPSPELAPEQIAAIFGHNTNGIRLGLLMTTLAAAMQGLWVATVTVQMRRIEGPASPLAFLQLGFGILGCFEFMVPVMIWQSIAFRPDSDPVVMQKMNDTAWLMFVGLIATGLLQVLSIGVAALRDQRPDPVFPRWVGYFNLFVAASFCPAGMIVFFHNGPFAWNGIFTFWLLLASFTAWLVVMTWVLLSHSIPQQVREEQEVVS